MRADDHVLSVVDGVKIAFIGSNQNGLNVITADFQTIYEFLLLEESSVDGDDVFEALFPYGL